MNVLQKCVVVLCFFAMLPVCEPIAFGRDPDDRVAQRDDDTARDRRRRELGKEREKRSRRKGRSNKRAKRRREKNAKRDDKKAEENEKVSELFETARQAVTKSVTKTVDESKPVAKSTINPETPFAVLQNDEVVGEFDDLAGAVESARPGQTVEIHGFGPYEVAHVVVDKPLTIRAASGMRPVLKFALGYDRLGLIRDPSRDPDAQYQFIVREVPVTFEGLELRMDPPPYNAEWAVISATDAALRLLNCQLSKTNREAVRGLRLRGDSLLIVRNCIMSGLDTAADFEVEREHEINFENCLVYGSTAIRAWSAPEASSTYLAITLTENTFQVTNVLDLGRMAGEVNIAANDNIFRADWIAESLLSSKHAIRAWQGDRNLYDINRWIGVGGVAVREITSLEDWREYWKATEEQSRRLAVPWIVYRQLGNYSHSTIPTDWALDQERLDAQRIQQEYGMRPILVGPGAQYDVYSKTQDYAEWTQDGKLLAQSAVASADLGQTGTGGTGEEFMSGVVEGMLDVLGSLGPGGQVSVSPEVLGQPAGPEFGVPQLE